MLLGKVNEGLFCMINCHQNKKNSQKGHKKALNSQKLVSKSIFGMGSSNFISA